MRFIKFNTRLLILFLALVLMACSVKRSEPDLSKNRIIGVKIYDYTGNLSELFAEWESLGINTVFSSASLDSNPEFRQLARQHKIRTFIILPIFFNLEALHSDPDLYALTNRGTPAVEEWVEFVCPSREDYRKQKIDYIMNLVHDLDPDGLSLDFIRHFVFWEKVYPDRKPEDIPNTCFNIHCLQKFQSERNIQIPADLRKTSEIYAWIQDNCLAEWTNWKCELITSMIRDIATEARKIKPEIQINVHAVPWRQNDFDGSIKTVVGQDFSKIGDIVDLISPMTYAHMVRQKPEWVSSVTKDIAGQVKCAVVPSIQVNKAYLEEPVSLEEFEESLHEALKEPSRGVIFWSWDQLVENPAKKEIVRELLRK
jgi:hypothetical protein